MKKLITSLRIPAHHKRIYNDYGDEDIASLAEHMDKLGQITPIVISKNNAVISGARRVAAARSLGWKSIDAVIREIPKGQELYFIISANKQRSKTAPQICEEIDALWKYYSKGQGFRRDLNGDTCANQAHKNPKTRDLVAADLGVSNKFIQQIRYIKSKRSDLLPYLFRHITLTACYAQVKLFENQKEILKNKKKNGRHIPLDGVNFQLYTQSAVDMSNYLSDDSIDHICTSPPYYAQRVFHSTEEQDEELGQEEKLADYIQNLVAVIAECKRVMKVTGSMYINLGDTYHKGSKLQVPERLSIAISDTLGLYLRNTLIWWKNQSMTPESAKNRRHTDFEFVYHFTKHPSKYFYDADEIRIPYNTEGPTDRKPPRHLNLDWDQGWKKSGFKNKLDWERGYERAGGAGNGGPYNKDIKAGVNPRWVSHSVGGEIAEPTAMSNLSSSVRHPIGKIPGCILEVSRHTQPHDFDGLPQHSAPYPEKLVRELLKPVARPGDVIYDPFSGSGTTGAVALEFGCNYIGADVNENFNELASARLNALNEKD